MQPTESSRAQNPEIRYERTDAGVRPLYQFLFWISVLTIVTAVFSYWAYARLMGWDHTRSSASPMADLDPNRKAPEPRLQTREALDYAGYLAAETEKLNSWGVIDPSRGVYRMPIEEAMKRVIERGLPTSPTAVSISPVAAPQAATAPTPAPPPARGGHE